MLSEKIVSLSSILLIIITKTDSTGQRYLLYYDLYLFFPRDPYATETNAPISISGRKRIIKKFANQVLFTMSTASQD